MNAQGKTIVVTGGGSGMGRELVLGLLARNATVAAVDINQTSLQETAQMAGNLQERLTLHIANIASRESVETLAAEIIAKHGAVDGLINNAGIIQPFVKINDLEYPVIERVMNVDFFGTLYMIKAFLPHFLTRPEAHIVNISSMGGFLPVPGQAVYGAAKAAVKLLTESLHSEFSDTNVKVTVIYPGAVGTNITQNSGVTMKTLSPEQIKRFPIQPLEPKIAAGLILDGMERNQYQVFVGKDSTFLNVLYRLSPQRATAFIGKQMRLLLS